MKDYIENAEVVIEDEMTVKGSVEIDEDGTVTIIRGDGRYRGKRVLTHISKCIIKELS